MGISSPYTGLLNNNTMRILNFATKLVMLNVLYFIVYNTYFGWNWKPQSPAEILCDDIFDVIMNIALVIFGIPLFNIYHRAVKKEDELSKLEKLTKDNSN